MNFSFLSHSKWTKIPKTNESVPESFNILALNSPYTSEPFNIVTQNPFSSTNNKSKPYSNTSEPPFAPFESGGFKDSDLVKPGWKDKDNNDNNDSENIVWFFVVAMSGVLSFLVLVLVLIGNESTNGKTPGGDEKRGPSSIVADIGVVAADEERCSHVGIDTLKLGGNAIDAAIATCLCLGVLNPMASGIGGGGFMLIRLANGTSEVIDSREEAPSAAHQDMYNGTDASSVKGGLSVAVPGELAGLYLAWQRYGKLTWNDLFRPAINFAENGFKVSEYLAVAINASSADILSSPTLSSVFAPSGTPLKKRRNLQNAKISANSSPGGATRTLRFVRRNFVFFPRFRNSVKRRNPDR